MVGNFFRYWGSLIMLLCKQKIIKFFVGIAILIENIKLLLVIMFCPKSDIKNAINSLFSVLGIKIQQLEQNFHCLLQRKNLVGGEQWPRQSHL